MKGWFLFFLCAPSLYALTGQGELRLEMREFRNDKKPETVDKARALFGRVEAKQELFDINFHGRVMGRADHADSSRDFVVIEELYGEHFFGGEDQWSLGGGYRLFNWSSMEAFKLLLS